MNNFVVGILFCCSFFSLTITPAQTPVADSLQTLLQLENNDLRKAEILIELSGAMRSIDFQKSAEFADQAFQLAEKTSMNTQEAAKSLLYKGVAYYYQGNYDKAMEAYLQSLARYEKLNDKRGMASVWNEIGTFHKKQGDTDKALTNFQDALTLSSAINDSAQIANSMNNLGIVYELKGDFKRAMEFYQESATIKEALHDLNGVTYNYDNMGTLLAKSGRYREAERYLLRVIDLRKQLGDRGGYAIALNNLGELFFMQGEYARSRTYLLEALAITMEIDYKDLRRHIFQMLAETYQMEKNYSKAYDYMMKSVAVKDSIFNEQKSRQIVDMEKKYETEKKESEIRILKQENEIKDFRLQRNQIFTIALVMVLLALVGLGYLWTVQTRLKQKAELEATRASLKERQLQAVIASQEEERKRFAADLHDGLGQMISALRLNLSHEELSQKSVEQAVVVLNEMNGEIRNIAFNLMPQVLMNSGLPEALEEFANRMNRTGKIQVKVQAFKMEQELPMEQKIALYRVCQEWVNNVVKYSGCKSITLQVINHGDEVVITVEDDGHGFDSKTLVEGQGNGWKNINSRLGLIKGTIEIDSQSGRIGTTAVISAPLVS
ncbi:MAG: tetratricopeptide repeat protein [Cyclobacteriaceae bacterium]|nr:tetratricopeptide repeat protein [Cyclobacteriaceae bacterium]